MLIIDSAVTYRFPDIRGQMAFRQAQNFRFLGRWRSLLKGERRVRDLVSLETCESEISVRIESRIGG